MSGIHTQKIIILDFGSQYSQLIARRIREAKVFSQILPFNTPLAKIREMSPQGIILSGGPASVYALDAPHCDSGVFNLGIPILGICYGMQLITRHFGGQVERAGKREYGLAQLKLNEKDTLFAHLPASLQVWMSHGDKVLAIPPGFVTVAYSENSPVCAMRHKDLPLYGVQFHPEVVHTPQGKEILHNFVSRICGCQQAWNMSSFVNDTVARLSQELKDKRVICALSGGVDSSVTAVLLHKAIGNNLQCIFVNNGLLRQGEAQMVQDTFQRHFHMNLDMVDAEERFLNRLRGVTDPEQKRKIIGNEFISVFEEEAHELKQVDYLAQGTLYPDVIESVSVKGPSATIKSHHNVGGLPEKMKLKLVEPLRELFKDEVRLVGHEMGLPDEIIHRQPFPGPGLAIRILGEVNRQRLDILRQADAIVLQEFKCSGWYGKVWQSFAVLLPVKTVGVMGDERTYENVIALRVVDSQDGMTADWVQLPYELLGTVSRRIINEVSGVNRVVYDISSKPPSTIEWE